MRTATIALATVVAAGVLVAVDTANALAAIGTTVVIGAALTLYVRRSERWAARDLAHLPAVTPSEVDAIFWPDPTDDDRSAADDAGIVAPNWTPTPIFDTVAAFRAHVEAEAELTDANLAARLSEWEATS